MKLIHFLLILATAICVSCNDKDEDVIKKASTNKTTLWLNGSPEVRSGATSADIKLETEKSATVYFVLATDALALTPDQIMAEASSPTLPSIVHNAVTQTPAKEAVIESVEKLKEHKTYHGYFLALADGETVADKAVHEIKFSTAIRQDTASFFSAFENRNINYLLYKPESVFKNPEQKYPIIFFLGGHGETATSSKPVNIIQNGLLPEYIHKGNNVPMMVMSVQHVQENWHNELIAEAMDHALKSLPIDKSKVFLVGTSGGAFGVWRFAQEFPERISAIVPISGGGDTEKACALNAIGIWAFTNKEDHLVPSGKSMAMVRAINDCAPKKEVKLKVFPDRGHDCWRRVFDKNHPDWSKSPQTEKVDIYQWLMTQSKPTSN
jgi:predicted peptidase